MRRIHVRTCAHRACGTSGFGADTGPRDTAPSRRERAGAGRAGVYIHRVHGIKAIVGAQNATATGTAGRQVQRRGVGATRPTRSVGCADPLAGDGPWRAHDTPRMQEGTALPRSACSLGKRACVLRPAARHHRAGSWLGGWSRGSDSPGRRGRRAMARSCRSYALRTAHHSQMHPT